jgi:hypothetical protein
MTDRIISLKPVTKDISGVIKDSYEREGQPIRHYYDLGKQKVLFQVAGKSGKIHFSQFSKNYKPTKTASTNKHSST